MNMSLIYKKETNMTETKQVQGRIDEVIVITDIEF